MGKFGALLHFIFEEKAYFYPFCFIINTIVCFGKVDQIVFFSQGCVWELLQGQLRLGTLCWESASQINFTKQVFSLTLSWGRAAISLQVAGAKYESNLSCKNEIKLAQNIWFANSDSWRAEKGVISLTQCQKCTLSFVPEFGCSQHLLEAHLATSRFHGKCKSIQPLRDKLITFATHRRRIWRIYGSGYRMQFLSWIWNI